MGFGENLEMLDIVQTPVVTKVGISCVWDLIESQGRSDTRPPQGHGPKFSRLRGRRRLGRSLSPGATNWCRTLGSPVRAAPNLLLANYSVSVGIAHVLVSRVASSYRRDTVSASLGAGDAAIPVIVL